MFSSVQGKRTKIQYIWVLRQVYNRSYVPQKNKAVCAISTMYFTKVIIDDTRDEKKPYILTHIMK